MVWLHTIGIVFIYGFAFFYWYCILSLVYLSNIFMVFYYWYGFLSLVWFSTIGMTVFYCFDFVPFSLFCAVCNGLVLLVWFCAVDMVLCPSLYPS